MKSFQGAVLFVDMLGFSALTRGKVTLGTSECQPWNVDPKGNFPHQVLAASLLLEFRRTLLATKKKFRNLRIAQLSDCAFLWSADVGVVVDAGRHLMGAAALKGLLCRGGLAFGDVHEPDRENTSLGAFIVGDAVTRAATYETLGKGTRVFTDPETADKVFSVRPTETIHQLVNPLTGETYDEWQWYVPNTTKPTNRNSISRFKDLAQLVAYHTTLRYSPKLAWSATTLEGRRQIACSVVAVSEVLERLAGNPGTYEFTVEQLLTSGQPRSNRALESVMTEFLGELAVRFSPSSKRGRGKRASNAD